MNISEIIAELEAIKAREGDLDCVVGDGDDYVDCDIETPVHFKMTNGRYSWHGKGDEVKVVEFVLT